METYTISNLYSCDKKILNYNSIINNYEFYLDTFLDENYGFYPDLDYLYQVVFGFSTIHDKIFSIEGDNNIFLNHMIDKYNNFTGKKSDVSNRIFYLTLKCREYLVHDNLFDCSNVIINEMYKNCYYIDEYFEKKIDISKTM